LLSSALHVVEYNLLSYRRSYRGSLFSSFVQPTLFLAAMGLSLGGIVDRAGAGGRLDGGSYLGFLAPGLLASAGMQAAFSEATFPIIAQIVWVRTYLAMVATPVTATAVALGQLIYICFRLALVTGIFTLVIALFGAAHGPGLLLAWPAAVLTGLAFAGPIAAFSATRKTEGSFNVLFRFGMTPLFLFSGAFFPIEQLPGALQPLAVMTPLYHGVALARGLAIGAAEPTAMAGHAAYLLVLSAIGVVACLITFRWRLIR
jgi:lipooligosaccharide transport system permease protein